MNFRTRGPRGLASWSGLLCLLLFVFPSSAYCAPSLDSRSESAAFISAAAPPAPVLFAEQSRWTVNGTYKELERFLTSRAHLVQFCTVGMVVALFVIMRNKW
jgi:hypothetical protein